LNRSNQVKRGGAFFRLIPSSFDLG
jgi:hypothetical protein